MNARDYIYNALHESMYALGNDLEGLSSYLDMDFDDYFGVANSQIVKDENGTEVLSEVADEYVEGKVVCTAEEGREIFNDIKYKVLTRILQNIFDNSKEPEKLYEEDFEEEENNSTDTIPMFVRIGSDEIGVSQFVPKNKRLKLIYSQVWNGGYSEENGISSELYDYATHDLELFAIDIPKLLGCTHVFRTAGGDIYGFIEQKEDK